MRKRSFEETIIDLMIRVMSPLRQGRMTPANLVNQAGLQSEEELFVIAPELLSRGWLTVADLEVGRNVHFWGSHRYEAGSVPDKMLTAHRKALQEEGVAGKSQIWRSMYRELSVMDAVNAILLVLTKEGEAALGALERGDPLPDA